MTKETGKFPTQAKNATYGYINLPCDSRVRLLGGASIPGLQNLLGMTARPIVSVDWAGPQFRTVDAKGFTAWRFLEEIFRHGLEDALSCSAFVIYLPDCYLTTGGSPACQPLCIICGPSAGRCRSILCVAKVLCVVKIDSRGTYINSCECANERQGETQKVAAQSKRMVCFLFYRLTVALWNLVTVSLQL